MIHGRLSKFVKKVKRDAGLILSIRKNKRQSRKVKKATDKFVSERENVERHEKVISSKEFGPFQKMASRRKIKKAKQEKTKAKQNLKKLLK